jgi:membrane protease YdiL (CAAX protease family)
MMMGRVSRLADQRPGFFAVLALLTWVILDVLIMAIAALLLKMPFASAFIRLTGMLGATAILLWVSFRMGWLGEIGITKPGTWRTWGIALVLAIYVLLFGFYAYFGDFAFQLRSLFETKEAREILVQMLIVGFVEETVFRGILLYALMRVWGRTKRGLVAAVVVQAALFGVLHALQAFAGLSLAAGLANVLATFIFGLWTGVLVLAVGSLWPAILLHAASNAFTIIKGFDSRWIEPGYAGYVRGALVELPLVLLGLWILLKVWPGRRASLQAKVEQDSRS